MRNQFTIYCYRFVLAACCALLLTGCGKEKRTEEERASIEEIRQQGITAYGQGDYEAALTAFREGIEACGAVTDELYGDLFCYCGACLYEEQAYEEAIESFETAICYASEESLDDAYLMEGCCYVALGDENAAATLFEACIGTGRADFDAYCCMYRSFKEAGFQERAESYLKRLISAEDSSNLLIGKCYYYLGSFSDAKTFLEKSMDEGEREAVYFLALDLEAMEDYDRTEEFYQTELTKLPDDATLYNQYGAYLIRREAYEKALEVIEEGLALEADEETAQALSYNEAVCYEYLSDYAKAEELMEAYVALYPEDDAAAKELMFLRSR